MQTIPATSLVNQIVGCTLGLLVFSGTLGLGAVWARRGISDTANRSRALEVQIADVERRIDEINAEVASAVTPLALQKQNEAMQLALVTPTELQVQRVEQSATDHLAQKRNREIFLTGDANSLYGDSAATKPAAGAGVQTSFRLITASLR